MRKHIHTRIIASWALSCAIAFLFAFSTAHSQQNKSYTVKDGKMYIELGKQIPESSIDSFINQYDLHELDIKQCAFENKCETLIKNGWMIEKSNSNVIVLSKPLFGYEKIDNPAEKILITDKYKTFAERFPPESDNVRFGYNRFRNKHPFAVDDSVMTFFLRGNKNARKVILSGSFIDWSENKISMTLTDSGWIAMVKLGPGKYWYKFIIDNRWYTDDDNLLREGDGLGNTNSVVFKTNSVFSLPGYENAKKVWLAGSFNNWKPRDIPLAKTWNGWELPVYLAKGTHTYRFIVDDNWMPDPNNPERLPNEYNDINSVIRLGKPYVFHLDGYNDAKQVVIAGSFNGWRKDELYMKKTENGWTLTYTLGPGNYEYNFIVDGKTMYAGNPERGKGAPNRFFVIDPNYTFRLKGYANAKSVLVAGDFNKWSPNTFAMKREGDEWLLDLHLEPGKRLYKLIIDNKWVTDPGNQLWEQNEFGTGNSIIWIEKKW